MRVATMRSGAAEAGSAGAIEMLKNGGFGEYLDSPSTIRCAPGGAPALR